MSVHTGDDPCLICDSCFDQVPLPPEALPHDWRSATIGRTRLDFCPKCEAAGHSSVFLPADLSCRHTEAINVLNVGAEPLAQCVTCGKLGRLLRGGGVIWSMRMARPPGAADYDSELRPTDPDPALPKRGDGFPYG